MKYEDSESLKRYEEVAVFDEAKMELMGKIEEESGWRAPKLGFA